MNCPTFLLIQPLLPPADHQCIQRQFDRKRRWQGILQPANQVQLGFGISGRLVTLNVKAGDQVTKGQLLAQLDNTDELVKYAQAQRTLANLTSPAAIAQAQNECCYSYNHSVKRNGCLEVCNHPAFRIRTASACRPAGFK